MGLCMGNAFMSLAKEPMMNILKEEAATRKLSLCGQVTRATPPSTNWFMWFPLKITGPWGGIFSFPRISMLRKERGG